MFIISDKSLEEVKKAIENVSEIEEAVIEEYELKEEEPAQTEAKEEEKSQRRQLPRRLHLKRRKRRSQLASLESRLSIVRCVSISRSWMI